VFFLMLTIAAVLIPARRAASLDPVAALRAE
jgi:ABC-type lipoprotein release transport system permease subunit